MVGNRNCSSECVLRGKIFLHSSDEHIWRRKSNDQIKPECPSQNNFADEGELLKGMRKTVRHYDENTC